MIERLSFGTNRQALRLLQLQMSAYRVEAELIASPTSRRLKTQ
ncbi:hypothetical protein [Gordoniibacillus kamchatkensis]